MSRPRLAAAAVVLLVIVLVGAAAGGGYLITHKVRVDSAATGAAAPSTTPSAVVSATAPPPDATTSSQPPPPRPAALSSALAKVVAAPALGGHVLAQVSDAATGAVLYRHLDTATAAPASTAKLLTAAALLTVRPATYRISTTVVTGSSGAVVLVGGGDPTLTGAEAGHAGAYPDAARISDLAAQLQRAHVTPKRIVVDDSLFSGPSVAPQWAPGDVPTFYAAPITAVMADGGRAAPGDEIRSATPDLAAGREFAAALGLPASAVTLGRAATGARTLATVQSPSIAELIDQMLQASDNVIAECLARQVALAAGRAASFTGAAAAIRSTLIGLGADPGGRLVDGSGLSAADRLSPAALVDVLQLVAGTAHPALHDLVTALPVAAWSGTLSGRYLRGSGATAGAGVVRAKTGTLTSVSSLAGFVHDADGRLLAFAVLADRVPPGDGPTASAEAALDRIAATLAGCGCR